ncbi:uncharacterized protein LOC143084913 [Mytilus galloprovincialis]|uniref:uncharacterized protein LOC143084913 n=1 Tax=Mytilus galloprovincialis TaxID=29158 RepID=UPI003F7C9BFC
MSVLISGCEQHEHEEVRFFCQDCKLLVCDDCITGPHKSHKFMKLKEFGTKCRNSLLKAITDAEDSKIPQIKESISKASDVQTILKSSVSEQVELIRTKRQMIDDTFDELQNELIENLNSEEKIAENEYKRFIRTQEKRIVDIQTILETCQTNSNDIPDTDIAKYHVILKKLLEHDPYTDTIPNLQVPIYQFNEEFATKSKLRHIMGHTEAGIYEMLQPIKSQETASVKSEDSGIMAPQNETLKINEEDNISYVNAIKWNREELQLVVSFASGKDVVWIIPQEIELCAWLIAREVNDLDCRGANITLKTLKNLDQVPITASVNTKNSLVIGFANKKSLKQLTCSTSAVTRKTSFSLSSSINIGELSLCCICKAGTSEDELIVCLFDKSAGDRGRYVIRRHSSGKSVARELSLYTDKVDITNPVQISENKDGLFCIICRPAKESWVLVVDKNGNQRFRFPSVLNPGETEDYDIAGAGFLNRSLLTITSRSKREQYLVNIDGQCIQKDKLRNTPVCCTVSSQDYVWIGFDGGEIAIFKYTEDHVYSSIEPKTHM